MRIVHCLRAPVGGLFRHVRDLAREQAARGHAVGVICDSNANDALTEARLAEIRPCLQLGLHKIAMGRDIGFSDVAAARATIAVARSCEADVLHGHGAKGGVYARVAARALSRSGRKVGGYYTPHGGSLHFDPRSLKGIVYMTAERALLGMTDGILFESGYSARVYAEKVARPRCPTRVVHNGVLQAELVPVHPGPGASDLIFIGELRSLKGVDVLLRAMAALAPRRAVTATIVGAGPDAVAFRSLAHELDIDSRVRFLPPMPAREAFKLGRVLVVPSRAESLPYVVLEGAAAGLPLIASDVGGIREIVGAAYAGLVPPGDAGRLAAALVQFLDDAGSTAGRAEELRRIVASQFSVASMTDAILDLYSQSAASGKAAASVPAAAARIVS